MPDPVIVTHYDKAIEEHAMRKQGMVGRGPNANSVFSIDYKDLPPEARRTIQLIIAHGPFPCPDHDGKPFGNHFGDLPTGQYLEYTVPTPGCGERGMRRIVASKRTGLLFFTACHYERVQAKGGTKPQNQLARQQATAATDEDFRNGFYIITGMPVDLRDAVRQALRTAASPGAKP